MGKKVQEEEYEVEYINSHKIETKKNVSYILFFKLYFLIFIFFYISFFFLCIKKKTLKFEIKWKGYPAEQNTWETPEAT